MSYLESRPQRVVEEPKSRAWIPVILIIIAILIVVAVIIILIILSRPASSGCTSDSNCPSAAPKCNNGVCVGCLSNSDCPTGKVCDSTNNCIVSTCKKNADCTVAPNNVCNTSTGKCQECLSAADCPIPNSTCNINGQCIPPCSAPPNQVTNPSVSGTAGTQTVTWNPPSGGATPSFYLITQEGNPCQATPQTIISSKTVQFGTNSVIFTGVAPGADCYRIQATNACGALSLANSASVTGFTCAAPPNPPAAANINLHLQDNCVVQASFSQPGATCPCPCDPLSCALGLPGCPNDCSGPVCPGPINSFCLVSINWNGGFQTSAQGLIFTRTSVRDQCGNVYLPSESTIAGELTNTGLYAIPVNWFIGCGQTCVVEGFFISVWAAATVTFPTTNPTPYPFALGSQTVTWNPISGADEYVVYVDNSGYSFGTIVAGNINSYTFITTCPSTQTSVKVWGYSLCNKSSGTLVSVNS